ncbi:MAG: hypothetical protein K2X93_06720 [Candidatus Obscuribacterales bacterium]|nr:hypothetical protein [Candidatus Obscuribacterales bacterium]
MGTTGAFPAAGSQLKKGTGGTTTDYSTVSAWTAVGDIQSFDMGFGRNMIDCTHMTSPNNEEEHINGRRTRKPFQYQGSFAPGDATHAPASGFLLDRDNGTIRGYAQEFADTAITTLKFNARVAQYDISANQAGKVDFSLTLQVTGAHAWSTGGA